ncbi:hypothetical protein KKF61_07880, partial [Patescibacteria group bacterium]|nr:hypothetical protein [Patescibacteria group bacterium]
MLRPDGKSKYSETWTVKVPVTIGSSVPPDTPTPTEQEPHVSIVKLLNVVSVEPATPPELSVNVTVLEPAVNVPPWLSQILFISNVSSTAVNVLPLFMVKSLSTSIKTVESVDEVFSSIVMFQNWAAWSMSMEFVWPDKPTFIVPPVT